MAKLSDYFDLDIPEESGWASIGPTISTSSSITPTDSLKLAMEAKADVIISFKETYKVSNGYYSVILHGDDVPISEISDGLRDSTTYPPFNSYELDLYEGDILEINFDPGAIGDGFLWSEISCNDTLIDEYDYGGSGDSSGSGKKGAYIGVENFTPRTLPSGFTQVEYLESSGTQYIDTGFKHNQNTRICVDIQNTQSEKTTWAFGGRISNTSATIGVFYWTNNSSWGADYNGNSKRFSFSSLTAYERLFIDYNKNVLTINEQVHEFSAGTFQSTANLALLAVNTGGTVSGYMSARLYSCKIYDNGTLIRDYVPCVNSSGVAGLFDLACYGFYTNNGTGTFTAGPTFSGVARKVKKAYIGVSGVAQKIKKAYIGIGGVARPCWSGGEPVYYGKIDDLTYNYAPDYYSASSSTDDYAIFATGISFGKTAIEPYDAVTLTKITPSQVYSDYLKFSGGSFNGCAWFANNNQVSNGSYLGIGGWIFPVDNDLTIDRIGAPSSSHKRLSQLGEDPDYLFCSYGRPSSGGWPSNAGDLYNKDKTLTTIQGGSTLWRGGPMTYTKNHLVACGNDSSNSLFVLSKDGTVLIADRYHGGAPYCLSEYGICTQIEGKAIFSDANAFYSSDVTSCDYWLVDDDLTWSIIYSDESKYRPSCAGTLGDKAIFCLAITTVGSISESTIKNEIRSFSADGTTEILSFTVSEKRSGSVNTSIKDKFFIASGFRFTGSTATESKTVELIEIK